MKIAGRPLTGRRIFQIVISTIGFVGTAIGIYAYFFEGKHVLLQYEITNNTKVLDINADITQLDVIYNGSSLKTKGQNLRIINVLIKNEGTECILKNYYDNNDPIGISVSHGQIIEQPQLLSSSNEYLKKNLKIHFDSTGVVTFNDVILEPGEFYIVKVLVLYSSKIEPTIQAIGKVAGQKNIPVITKEVIVSQSFFVETFGGNVVVQVVRAVSYTVVFLILIIGIGVGISELSDKRRKNKRKQITHKFKETKEYEYNKMDDAIFSHFIELDEDNLWEFHDLLKDEKEIKKLYSNWKQDSQMKNTLHSDPDISIFIEQNRFVYGHKWELMHQMIKEGFVFVDDAELAINRQMKTTLSMFIDYLQTIAYSNPNKLTRVVTRHKYELADRLPKS
ncbi:MAG TPA: hypothetical protein VK826_03780 [Bacteroidia bacterium]|nr:hypothetical protein [Bacteroidia bacterium]